MSLAGLNNYLDTLFQGTYIYELRENKKKIK